MKIPPLKNIDVEYEGEGREFSPKITVKLPNEVPQDSHLLESSGMFIKKPSLPTDPFHQPKKGPQSPFRNK